jgi:hypothetical protein
MTRTRVPRLHRLEIQTPSNGRLRKSTIVALDEKGESLGTHSADLISATERGKAAKDLAKVLQEPAKKVRAMLEAAWNKIIDQDRRIREQAAAGSPEAAPAAEPERRPSAASALVGLVRAAGAELFHTPDHAPFARVRVGEHHEVLPIRSRAFRNWCRRLYYQAEGGAPGTQAVEDALGVLEAEALFAGPEYPAPRPAGRARGPHLPRPGGSGLARRRGGPRRLANPGRLPGALPPAARTATPSGAAAGRDRGRSAAIRQRRG